MKQQRKASIWIIPLICLLLMICGCTEQNTPSETESLQSILERTAIIESVSYHIDIETAALETATTVHIWQQSPYFKIQETTTAGNLSTNQTIIRRPEGLYRYNELSQVYEPDTYAIISHPTTQEIVNDLLTNQTPTILGTETIDGKTTTVIQYNPSETGNSTTMKLWIWNEKGVLLRAEHTSSYEETTLTTYYTYSDYSFERIPEDIFSVE